MTEELDALQSARFTSIDPLLPAVSHVPDGERIEATLPDGRVVAGILVHTTHTSESLESLWGPLDNFEITPLLGDTGPAGMDALLGAFDERMRAESPGPDSVRTVLWPSRAVGSTQAFLRHGYVPINALAVRPKRRGSDATRDRATADGITVRRAQIDDVPALAALSLVELEYSAAAGAGMMRENAASLTARGIGRSIFFGGRVWLAEVGGEPVGMADCGTMPTTGRSPINGRVHPGRWGYVLTLSVAPAARGRGVGTVLMDVVHDEFSGADIGGSVLFYSPSNPLSSVFWPRQGYRPLWTVWERRPAGPRA